MPVVLLLEYPYSNIIFPICSFPKELLIERIHWGIPMIEGLLPL